MSWRPYLPEPRPAVVDKPGDPEPVPLDVLRHARDLCAGFRQPPRQFRSRVEKGFVGCYYVESDIVAVNPDRADGDGLGGDDGYYTSLLHELLHATGHPSRLHRKTTGDFSLPGYEGEEGTTNEALRLVLDEIGFPAAVTVGPDGTQANTVTATPPPPPSPGDPKKCVSPPDPAKCWRDEDGAFNPEFALPYWQDSAAMIPSMLARGPGLDAQVDLIGDGALHFTNLPSVDATGVLDEGVLTAVFTSDRRTIPAGEGRLVLGPRRLAIGGRELVVEIPTRQGMRPLVIRIPTE